MKPNNFHKGEKMKKIFQTLIPMLILATLLTSACTGAAAPANNSLATKVQADLVDFTGVIESINGDQWVVNGKTVTVDPSIVRDGPFKVGDTIKVEAKVESDGSITVTRVENPLTVDNSNNANSNDVNSNDANSNDINSNDANSNSSNSNDVNVNDSNSNVSNSNDSNSNDDNGNDLNSNVSNSNDSNSNDNVGDDSNSNDSVGNNSNSNDSVGNDDHSNDSNGNDGSGGDNSGNDNSGSSSNGNDG